MLKWVYGVTTVPQRRYTLLPQTLQSLVSAGFDQPTLFVDGITHAEAITYERQFGLEVVCRNPKIRTFGNWVLSLAEMYIREPQGDRYIVFQDDFVTYPNLRKYLERAEYPYKGYWNFYTFPSNHALIPLDQNKKPMVGWHKANQNGRGAVALGFDRQTVLILLTHLNMVERPMSLDRGWKSVDGGVVNSLNNAGWAEYFHYPSLVQHTGIQSSMGNKTHLLAPSFRGESYDASQLIQESTTITPEITCIQLK